MSCEDIPEYDICRKRGDTYQQTFQLLVDGVGHDITGDQLDLAVNSEENPSDTSNQLFLLSTTTTGITIPAGTTGLFTIETPAAIADAVNYVPGTYYYDLQWTDDPGGTPRERTIMRGKWIIVQDITKV